MNNADNQKLIENQNTKIYNSQQWAVTVYLEDLYTNQFFQLITNQITKIKIVNSLQQFVPTIQINYQDINFAVMDYLRPNRNYFGYSDNSATPY